MKTRKIILLITLGMVSVSLFAQQKILGQQDPDKVFKFVCNQYSKICEALNSEPIENLPEGENAVRLISTSDSPCYIIKLVWTNHKRTIDFTEGDVDGTKVVRTKTLDVSEESVNELLTLMKEKDFYNQIADLNISVRDGSEWFVEANIDGKYKAVVRPCPERTFLNAIGRKLLRMADEGLSDEELEVARKKVEEYNNRKRLLIKKR